MLKEERKPSCFNLVANIGLDEMKLVNLGTVDGMRLSERHLPLGVLTMGSIE